MSKLTGAGLERELVADRPGYRAYLLYGPDSGLIEERAATLARRVVDDISDPFRVALLAERDVIDDPARLSDEISAQSLLGGRRVVRVRGAGDRLGPILADRLPDDEHGGLLIVEAGDLAPRAALRKLFEGTDRIVAMACYADEGAALARVVNATLAEAGLQATRDAGDLLCSLLGADRRATRSELAKLVDYMGQGAGQITVDDVAAIVADDSGQAVDALAYAALGGRSAEAARLHRRLQADGTAAVAMLRGLARVTQRALIVADQIDRNTPLDDAVKSLRPPVFYKDANRFRAVVQRHTVAGLQRILGHLWATEKRVKSTGYPENVICGQAVLSIARRGGKR